jgi:hypothetical protein
MGKTREQYEKVLEKLKSSYTEEDIIENLTQIVKRFSVHIFKEDLVQNPFYKSLLIDIKSDVLEDLYDIKKSILNEMDLITSGIELGDDVDKLIQLKIECKLLLTEIEIKIEEIESI